MSKGIRVRIDKKIYDAAVKEQAVVVGNLTPEEIINEAVAQGMAMLNVLKQCRRLIDPEAYPTHHAMVCQVINAVEHNETPKPSGTVKCHNCDSVL